MKNQFTPIGIVVVNTMSNFRNVNNKELPLIEIEGRMVTAIVFDEYSNTNIKIDFLLSEVSKISTSQYSILKAQEKILK